MTTAMTTLELAALVMSAEFALVACIVPAVLWRRGKRQVASERQDAQRLLDGVETAAPTRREALSTIFATTYQLDGDDLEARVDEFISREQAFYEVMTSVYLERDSSRLKEIPEELTKVISPWIRLTPRNSVDRAEVDTLEATNSELNDRNAELAAELERTRASMDELMQEYLKSYRKGEAFDARADGAAATPLDDDVELAFDEEQVPAAPLADASGGDDGTDEDLLAPEDIDALFAATDSVDDVVADKGADDEEAAAGEDDDSLAASTPEAAADDSIDVSIDVSVDDDVPPPPRRGGTLSSEEADALAGLFDEEIAALDSDPDEREAAA